MGHIEAAPMLTAPTLLEFFLDLSETMRAWIAEP
jgi:hypothetical protein